MDEWRNDVHKCIRYFFALVFSSESLKKIIVHSPVFLENGVLALLMSGHTKNVDDWYWLLL